MSNVAKKNNSYGKGLTSIIIPTWNTCNLTQSCLYSLFQFTPQYKEVIVVDNGSEDGTKDYLKDLLKKMEGVEVTAKNFKKQSGQIFPLKCIFNETNRGFAGAVNQGLRIAQGEYLLLLNSDVILAPHWLRNMLICINSDQRIGLVGPRSNYVGGKQGRMENIPAGKDMERFHDFALEFNRLSNPAKWYPVESLSGFCLLLKRKVVDSIGFFDERFGLGTREDRDFCLRAEKKGFKIICAGDTFVFHFGSRTFKANGLDVGAIRKQNMVLYEKKWGHGQ